MKTVLHKTISLAMVILLLLSTTSWKVEKHYCMGQLMNMALFVDVDVCGMNMNSADDSENLSEFDDSCCDDEVFFVAGQKDLQLTWNLLDIDQQYFLIAFEYSYLNLLSAQTNKSAANEHYAPPLLVKDIQMLVEIYLI